MTKISKGIIIKQAYFLIICCVAIYSCGYKNLPQPIIKNAKQFNVSEVNPIGKYIGNDLEVSFLFHKNKLNRIDVLRSFINDDCEQCSFVLQTLAELSTTGQVSFYRENIYWQEISLKSVLDAPNDLDEWTILFKNPQVESLPYMVLRFHEGNTHFDKIVDIAQKPNFDKPLFNNILYNNKTKMILLSWDTENLESHKNLSEIYNLDIQKYNVILAIYKDGDIFPVISTAAELGKLSFRLDSLSSIANYYATFEDIFGNVSLKTEIKITKIINE